jgi:formylglycine-generating enzyme required for sulfatase activity
VTPRELTVVLAWAGAAALLSACVQEPALPRAQAVVHIDTDAPVPRMLDRLRITVLDEALHPVCDECTRDLALDDATIWPISFGVIPPVDGGRRFVRVTAFLSGRTAANAPLAATAVDEIAELRFGEGVLHQDVFLPFDCAGVPPDLAARTSCHTAAPDVEPIGPTLPHASDTTSRTGTWRAANTRACQGTPRVETPGLHDGERCIPGGSFWMGDYRALGDLAPPTVLPEHPVTVSPFFLDTTEYTVGRYRAALALGFQTRVPPLTRQNLNNLPEDDNNRCLSEACGSCCCTFLGEQNAANDDLPLTCVSLELAEQLCAWEHRSLPTEAQWEWAAGAREHEWLYPWGNQEPGCGMLGGLLYPPRWAPNTVCGPVVQWSSGPVASHPIDQTPDGVMDLAGSVSELTADSFQFYTERCWQLGAYGPDPLCVLMDQDFDYGATSRGGNFLSPTLDNFAAPARALAQSVFFVRAGLVTYGFRCARADR